MKSIIGIDYSITSPAIFVGMENDSFKDGRVYARATKKTRELAPVVSDNIHLSEKKDKNDFSSAEERYMDNVDWSIDKIISMGEPGLVVIEGYSMASKGQVFNIAENCAFLKYVLYEQSIPFIIPSPSSVKKVFAGKGKGSSNKFQMHDEFVHRTNINLRKGFNCTSTKKMKDPLSDIVDAYAMFEYGKLYLRGDI